MNVEPTQETLSIAIECDQLVIRVGIECLLNALPLADTWPLNYEGEPYRIVDNQQFLQDLICELERENAQGATLLHLALDQAATEVTEQGYESVEMPEESSD
ncbi:MAG: hypothetical protein ACRES5_34290 [Pseudomonas sp.]